ncbi:MAG TPA: DUF1707 domain-containing protein, partial [Polyangiaceae bacterium]|nr:DUF1707 domain-containing protein [Polyangiaceae bacterium]
MSAPAFEMRYSRGTVEGTNHPRNRRLHEARERVVSKLIDAFSQDELALEAFDRRINDAYQCQTEADLEKLVADLGGIGSDSQPAHALVLAPRQAPVVAELVPAETRALAPVRPRAF